MDSMNKKLIVTFSNNITCSGIMTVDFAKWNVGGLFPDKEIDISIEEILNVDNSRITLCERKNGEWEEIVNN